MSSEGLNRHNGLGVLGSSKWTHCQQAHTPIAISVFIIDGHRTTHPYCQSGATPALAVMQCGRLSFQSICKQSVCLLFLMTSDHCSDSPTQKAGSRQREWATGLQGTHCCRALLKEKASLDSRQVTTLGQLGTAQIRVQMGGSCSCHHPLKARSRKHAFDLVPWEAWEREKKVQVCHFKWFGCGKN